MNYYKYAHQSIILQSHTYSVTIALFCRLLYNQNCHQDALDMFVPQKMYPLNYSLSFLGQFLFYYCQVCGECSFINDMSLYARYTCGIERLLERPLNSKILINGILEDFSYNLDF